MIVLRRFDALLEPTKAQVLEFKKRLDLDGITDQDMALTTITKQAFSNSSKFNLRDLLASTSQQQLRSDFIDYLDGFSKNIQEIIEKFEFRHQLDKLSACNALSIVIERFVSPKINLSNQPVLNDDGSVKLPALDNRGMGIVFEELLRKFNEEFSVTEAGEHFTPRDIVELMTDLAFLPVADKIRNSTYWVYDGACGTGGILCVADERLKELAKTHGKRLTIDLYGQELEPDTFATARADLLIRGEGEYAKNILFGSTISQDGHATRRFDFMISNPPFGTPWKKDLERWGFEKKDEITDPRFVLQYDGSSEYSFVPNIGDPQMLFLANNVSKMKDTTFGSRIVEVHNGSSLFTGSAGQGESNLRRYLFERDLVEAIIQLPENMFYNTGITTYLWILSNRKEDQRKGKVQLIDASEWSSPLRKNLGDKNCELTSDIRHRILHDEYMPFKETKHSRIFPTEEFGYWEVIVERPLRLSVEITDDKLAAFTKETKLSEVAGVLRKMPKASNDYNAFYASFTKAGKGIRITSANERKIRAFFTQIDAIAEPVIANHTKTGAGRYEPDPALRDTEQIPLRTEGGIGAFFRREVLPYAPDAWIAEDETKIGYEISFIRHFYQPPLLRTLAEISADILKLEQESDGLITEITKGIH
jgi:type I restriction enzyme M protein